MSGTDSSQPAAPVETIRRIARWGLMVGGVALVAGLIATVGGWTGVSRVCLLAGLGVFVALPVINVVAALVEEIRHREWVFLAATITVLAILIYNVSRAL